MANNQQQLDGLITELGSLGQDGASLLQTAQGAKNDQQRLMDSIAQLMGLVRHLKDTNINIDNIIQSAQQAKGVQTDKMNEIKNALNGNPDADQIQQIIGQAGDLIAQHGARPPTRGGYTYGASRKKGKGRRKRTKKSRRKGSNKKKSKRVRK
jgi:hypothetical protein